MFNFSKKTKHYKKAKLISSKRKRLSKIFSKKIIKSNLIVSFVHHKDETIKKQILRDNKNIIILKNVKKSFHTAAEETKVLKNINLKIKEGSIVMILGPSGSGKTSLLNIISGLDISSNGDVFVNKINLSLLKDKHLTLFRKKYIGFVFQQYHLLPNLNAKENIQLGANLNPTVKKEFIDKMVKTIGLKPHLKKYPYQMSGGQQQRVSIARAVSKNPKILFCDEPTGALDTKTGEKVLKILKQINKEFRTTIIFVTHNISLTKIADKVIYLNDGEIERIEDKHKDEKHSLTGPKHALTGPKHALTGPKHALKGTKHTLKKVEKVLTHS